MLIWKIKNGDDKLKAEIQRINDMFDGWYEKYWKDKCTREKMLSENSPAEHVYYKMTKTFEEVKTKYPSEALERCSSCGKYVDKWIETELDFSAEYNHSMSLCKDCATELKKLIDKL